MKKTKGTTWGGLKYGASLAVLGALAVGMVPTTAAAQDAVEGDEEVVVVTGVRASLRSAQDIKRNADTIVDSITAADLGAFPDKSVAEALQRVAGITVNRFAATGDTAHFSAEPSGVVVRGLQQVRNEFNGRDSFSANAGRGLSWTDVSPELLGGVDTYKNQTAELIEGGIAGTVNLRTRLPFDAAGRTFQLSANANYGDISQEFTPEISALWSDRWETEIGEFGLMANGAFSRVTTQSQGNQLYRMNIFSADDPNFAAAFPNAAADGHELIYIPAIMSMRDNTYYRDRTGYALAGQWESPDGNVLASIQYNSSQYTNRWEEYVVSAGVADFSYSQSVFYEVPILDGDGRRRIQPAPGTPDFTFDEQGVFETGTIVNSIGWWGADAAASANFADNGQGGPLVTPCYGWNGCEPQARGADASTSTRSNNNENFTEDLSANVKWTPTDRLRFNFDIQHINSNVQNYDIEIGMASFANVQADLTGGRPSISLLPGTNINYAPGGLANPTNYRYQFIMDHLEDSEAEQLAYRADMEYEFENAGWLDSIKVGYRRAEREQLVQWSGYNWQNVANVWSSNGGYYNVTDHAPCVSTDANCNGQNFNGYPTGSYETRQFGGDYFNLAQDQFVFFNMDLAQNRELMAASFGNGALGFTGGVGWDPICSNVGDSSDEIPGTCFTPAEVADVTETTDAFYAQLHFGGGDAKLFGLPFSGNIGVRYIETVDTSTGGLTIPQLTAEQLECEPNPGIDHDMDPMTPDIAPAVPNSVGCYLQADDIAFLNGANRVSATETTHDHVLPSFNIRLDLSDTWLIRFAASRAMSRPDMGNLRNYLGVSARLPSESDSADPLWIKDSGGTITGANVAYTGSAQNPALAPVVATQYDISLENYFSDVGSFSAAIFYKEFEDYIQFGTYFRDIENNGVTQRAEVRGPLNGAGASIQGFELSYQQFFDFLPGWLSGFGVQANYTYIDNQGIANQNTQAVGGDGTTVTGQAPDVVTTGTLEGLSEQSYNLVGMYEKGPLAIRLAYNWRSEFNVTAIDCCVARPIWQEDSGYLDGSIRYQLNDRMEISLQGSNLLNTETILAQQVTNIEDGGQRITSSWFQNDRRFVAGLRYKF